MYAGGSLEAGKVFKSFDPLTPSDWYYSASRLRRRRHGDRTDLSGLRSGRVGQSRLLGVHRPALVSAMNRRNAGRGRGVDQSVNIAAARTTSGRPW
ncbi:MAG: hypothetical protein MZW92_51950 [Comamonadaceae bacterium]|nr:hypothetical protein [Comamonadaceae bacterium]